MSAAILALHAPEQRKVIANLMASRKRQLTNTSAGSFPKWRPGMTTADYIRLYSIGGRYVLPFGPRVHHPKLGWIDDLSHLERPAPFNEDDSVVVEALQ